MRRWRILSALLAALCAAGILCSAAAVDRGGKPRYESELMRGDLGDFADVTVETETLWSDRLLWTTRFSPADDAADCARKFYVSSAPAAPYTPTLEITLSFFSHYGDPGALENIVRGHMQPGETSRRETLRLKDYFDAIPITVFSMVDFEHKDAAISREGQQAFARFFVFPISEDATAEVEVEIGPNSYGGSVGCTGLPRLTTRAALDEKNRWWFTVDLRDDDGNATDVSQIPGGAGVYCYDPAALATENVYPLPAEAEILDLRLSADESHLLLTTVLDGAWTLTVLNLPAGSAQQTLSLPDLQTPPAREVLYAHGALVLSDAEGHLCVLSEQPDGTFAVWNTLDAAEDPAVPGFWYCVGIAFDGERFAIAHPMADVSSGTEATDLHDLAISIYDKTGARSTVISRSTLSPDAIRTAPDGYWPDTSVNAVRITLG